MQSYRRIAVSDCLRGAPCRYDGCSKSNAAVLRMCEQAELVVGVCPECAGGLPTPRTPSEICAGQVLMRDGTDVTMEFERGAQTCLERLLAAEVELAILKERSPSCGSSEVYDGTFSGTTRPGEGIFARLCRAHGITVISEESLE